MILPRALSALSRVGVAAVLLASTSTASPTASAQADPTAPSAGYGFSTYGGNIQLSSTDFERELDAIQTTEARWLRIMLDSFRIETSKGHYDWSYPDMLVNAAYARGLKILLVVSYSPEWARPNGSVWSTPPTDAADYANFASAVAQRYRDRVSNWEIWNEPNDQNYLTYSGDVAGKYTELLKAAYVAIKNVAPTSTVISAGLSRAGQISPPVFMEGMYEAGAQGYFDAAAMHPYVSPGGLAADPYNGWSDVGRVHAIMSQHGDGGKSIWLTELGAPTIAGRYGVSENEQAKQISDVLAAAARTRYIGPAFIFTIRDAPGRGDDGEYTYGALLTADWQPKATATMLQAGE